MFFFETARAACENQNAVGTRSSGGFLSDLRFHFLDLDLKQEQQQQQEQ